MPDTDGPGLSAQQVRASALADHKTVLLDTRKRDGTWVSTPVNLAAEDGRVYFRTYDASGKAKRLRNFTEVRAAPCTFRGRPTGPTVTGRARLLDDDEADKAGTLLAQRFALLHGRLVPFVHRRKGWRTVHYELTLDPR